MFIYNKKKGLVLYIVNILLGLFWLPKRILTKKIDLTGITPQKILIIRLDHIGDVVMTTPAFSMLRNRFPKAKIFLLASAVSQQLFIEDPRIDNVFVFNWPWPHGKKKGSFSVLKIKQLINLIIQVRKEKIDVVIDFRGDLRFIVLFGILTGIKIRISNSRSSNSNILDYRSPYDVASHEVIRSIDVIKCFGNNIGETRPWLFIDDAEITAIKEFVETKTGLPFPEKLAIVGPYSSNDIKSWPLTYFPEVINDLLSKSFTIIVTGTDDDKHHAQKMIEGFEKNVFSFAGQTSVRQLAALTSVSNIVVGIDTGVLHIASCFDVPIVAIFGPTRSVEFSPYSPLSVIVETGTCTCNQFLHAKCDVPVDGFAKCLSDLDPALVIQAIDNILNA